MANITITRAQVLSAVVEGDFETLAREDAREVARKMLVSITRKSDAPKQPSKASVENKALAQRVYAEMQPDKDYTTADIMGLVRGIMTTQKCAVVMAVLIDAGLVNKFKTKKAITYRLV